MGEYLLKIADTNIFLSREPKKVSAIRLVRRRNEGDLFEFVLFDERLINKAGLGSIVQLGIDDDMIFRGRVLSEEIFSNASGRGKYISVLSPFGWCDYIRVKDDAGIPRLSFLSTTVGVIVSELINRHADEIRQIGAGDDEFFDELEINKLDEPIENVWFENRSLKSALQEILVAGDYALMIYPETLRWKIKPTDELDVYNLDLSRASENQLIEYRIRTDLSDRCSAVRLVSDRKTGIGYSSAVPAWDVSLETNWRMRESGFSKPDSDEPEGIAWVYRRYSYEGISGLLDNYPIELVQKVANESGGYSYQIIETVGIDRANKYVIAKWPILAVPNSGRINRRNGFIKGKSVGGEVYIRYRYYENEPEYSVRYPSEGFAGQAVDTAGLICEDVSYCSDIRRISDVRALKLWRNRSGIYQNIDLSIKGKLSQFSGLIRENRRVNIIASESVELPVNTCFRVEYIAYDFTRNLLRLGLKGGL